MSVRSAEFRAQSSRPNHSYLASNSLLIEETSPYHRHCIPKDTRERVLSAPPRTKNPKDYEILNHVAEEKRWDERVKKERYLQKKWDKNLGFYAEYDQYGEPKERKEIAKVVPSVYSLTCERPTSSREYGRRVNSAPARRMQTLQLQTNHGVRRNKDLIEQY